MGFGDRSTGRGTFGGEFGARTAYVCDSAATRPSSQITLGKLVLSARSVLTPKISQKSKMRFRPGLRPDLAGEAHDAPQTPSRLGR